jgi:hypothetical protein
MEECDWRTGKWVGHGTACGVVDQKWRVEVEEWVGAMGVELIE